MPLRGTPLVVIDPRRIEFPAAIADVHLQNQPGTNVPLLNPIAHVLVEERMVDEDFVAARAEGWDEYARSCARMPERTGSRDGRARAPARRALRTCSTLAPPDALPRLGVTEHLQGSEAVMLLVNLVPLAARSARDGVGGTKLRGQNNDAGRADMGCQPDSTTGYAPVDDPGARAVARGVGDRCPRTSDGGLPQIRRRAQRRRLRASVRVRRGRRADRSRHHAHARGAREPRDARRQGRSVRTGEARARRAARGELLREGRHRSRTASAGSKRVRAALPPLEGTRARLASCEPHGGVRLAAAVRDAVGRQGTRSRAREPRVRGRVTRGSGATDCSGRCRPRSIPASPIPHRESFPRGKGKLSCVEFVSSPERGGALTLTTGRILEHYNCGTMTRRSGLDAPGGEDLLEMHAVDADAAARR